MLFQGAQVLAPETASFVVGRMAVTLSPATIRTECGHPVVALLGLPK